MGAKHFQKTVEILKRIWTLCGVFKVHPCLDLLLLHPYTKKFKITTRIQHQCQLREGH